MPEETMSRELRIPLPQAEPRECFLAISFNGLHDISGAIAEALGGVRVLHKRTDISPELPEWPQNVVQGIRRADIIIAVINDKEKDRCRINANVAYEIGIACALEKPLIILAQNKQEDQEFFRDVQHLVWIDTHRQGNLDRDFLIEKLQNRLRAELNRTYHSHTWRDAKIINHVLHRRRSAVDGYEDARNYGKTILKTFQDFVRNHLTPLSEAALTFLLYETAIDIKKYNENYQPCQKYYLTTVEPLFAEMLVLKHKLVKSTSSWHYSELQYHLHKVHDAAFGDSIRDSYANLEKVHESAVIRTAGKNADENSNLSAGIAQLRKHCTDVISAAGDYLICLVNALIQINKGAAP